MVLWELLTITELGLPFDEYRCDERYAKCLSSAVDEEDAVWYESSILVLESALELLLQCK